MALLIPIISICVSSSALAAGCNEKATQAVFETDYCMNGNQIMDEFIFGSNMGRCGSDRCQPSECYLEHNQTKDTTVHNLDDVYEGCVGGVIVHSFTSSLNYTQAWDDPFTQCDVPEDCDNGGGPSD